MSVETMTHSEHAASLRGSARLLIGAAFTADAAVNARNLGTMFLAISLGASPLWLGLIYGAFTAGFAASALLVGGRSDRWGRKRCILLALGVVAGTLLWLRFCVQPWEIALNSLVFGSTMGLLWPSIEAWICDLSEGHTGRLNRLLGNFNLAWSSGLGLGALLGGVLWQALGVHSFLLLLGVVLIVMAALTRAWEPAHLSPSAPPPPQADLPPPDPTGRFLLTARLGNFLGWFTTAVILTVLPKLAEHLGISPVPTGVAISAYYVSLLLLMWLGRATDRWHYRVWPLVVPVPLVMFGAVLLALAGSWPAFALAAFVAGTCSGVAAVTSLFYALDGRHDGRAASTAIHEAVVAVAGIAGGLATGGVAQVLVARLGLESGLRGSILLILAVAVVIAVTQGLAWRLLSRRRPPASAAPCPPESAALPSPGVLTPTPACAIVLPQSVCTDGCDGEE